MAANQVILGPVNEGSTEALEVAHSPHEKNRWDLPPGPLRHQHGPPTDPKCQDMQQTDRPAISKEKVFQNPRVGWA